MFLFVPYTMVTKNKMKRTSESGRKNRKEGRKKVKRKERRVDVGWEGNVGSKKELASSEEKNFLWGRDGFVVDIYSTYIFLDILCTFI
jgi:hypothetical protein